MYVQPVMYQNRIFTCPHPLPCQSLHTVSCVRVQRFSLSLARTFSLSPSPRSLSFSSLALNSLFRYMSFKISTAVPFPANAPLQCVVYV